MATRKQFSRTKLSLGLLEKRLVPATFEVYNTSDFWLDGEPGNPASIPIEGSLRWAIDKATDAYDDSIVQPGGPTTPTITFNSSFANPLNPQAINLLYGGLVIERPVVINGPLSQFNDDYYPYVTIHWHSTPYGLGDPLEGTDWSVFHVSPEYPTNETNPRVTLGGLRIENGRASTGAGVQARGDFDLNITQCDILNNTAKRTSLEVLHNPDVGTFGGGVYAKALGSEDPFSGPNVTITSSKI